MQSGKQSEEKMKVSAHPIVGTWNLQSFSELDVHTKAVAYPMGEKPKATVIYTEGGHVATIFTAAARIAPTGPRATDSEAIQLFRTMVAFAGRYEINDRELIYYPEITWNEAWNGTRQIRYFELAGDLLKISSAPAVSTLGNAETIMTMAWNRV
jgi:hypothetical protein